MQLWSLHKDCVKHYTIPHYIFQSTKALSNDKDDTNLDDVVKYSYHFCTKKLILLTIENPERFYG